MKHMTIAFVSPLPPKASTNVGRIFPVATRLALNNEVHTLTTQGPGSIPQEITNHTIGRPPFKRHQKTKIRLQGILLVLNMLHTTIGIFISLLSIKPDLIIIVKPLPQNVLGVAIWKFFHPLKKIILDVDDFELTANVLSSFSQRAAIHAAERKAVRIANTICAASPFLIDHFQNLAKKSTKVHFLPTGISIDVAPQQDKTNLHQNILYIGSVSIMSGHRVDLLPPIFKKVKRKIPNATLTIAGDGDDINKIKTMFKKQKLNTSVKWTGRFNTEEINSLVLKAQILIDPIDNSITNRAKSSFRTLLASTYGKQIITSNIGIRPMLIPQSLHKKSFAVPAPPLVKNLPRNLSKSTVLDRQHLEAIENYALKIVAALRNPLHPADTLNAKKLVTNFDRNHIAKKYQDIINELSVES